MSSKRKHEYNLGDYICYLNEKNEHRVGRAIDFYSKQPIIRICAENGVLITINRNQITDVVSWNHKRQTSENNL